LNPLSKQIKSESWRDRGRRQNSIANVVTKRDSNYVRLLLTKTPKLHADQQYETKWEKFS